MRATCACAVIALLAVAGCGGADTPTSTLPAAGAAATDGTITFDSDGAGGEPVRRASWSCPADRVTTLCRALRRLPARVLRPVPRGVACAEVFRGPQTATLAGAIAGRPFFARFSRRNSCEEARYQQVVPVLRAAFGGRLPG